MCEKVVLGVFCAGIKSACARVAMQLNWINWQVCCEFVNELFCRGRQEPFSIDVLFDSC